MESLAVNPSFWRKRVLVTGHTGFKGSWLSLWLQGAGAEVSGIGLPPAVTPALFDVAGIGNGMEHHLVDVRHLDAVKRIFVQFRPEIVFHLAAQSFVRLSYEEPVMTFDTNVMGTVNVLEAARQCSSVKAIVIITSDKCYENREWVWGYREDEPMGGYDPYSSSKGCVELLTAAYRRSFLGQSGISVATARAGNVIGGGDWAVDRLVPDVLRALEMQQIPRIRNPEAIRPWQHVLEPISGYLLLAEKLYLYGQAYSEAWNFGPLEWDSKPVSWIVGYLCEKWGVTASWEGQPGEHPHEAKVLRLDTSKVRSRLNWNPRWSLEKALDEIVFWQKAWIDGQNMRALCEAQIRNYMEVSS